ncbi:MAG: hypothetical protein U0V02_03965 [Anaerolineales bacterium]
MLRILYPFVLIAALLVTGCAALPQQTPAATPALPVITNEWSITMNLSGGIMGLMRSVEVSSNGNYIVADERTKNKAEGKLSADELNKLSSIIKSATLHTSNTPGVSACADCFIYDIEIQSGGENFTVQLDDITLPASGMEELATFLRELIDSALN